MGACQQVSSSRGNASIGTPRHLKHPVAIGCAMGQETRWLKIVWDADVPPNTSLTVKARSGKTANLTDGSWGMWTQEFPDTPADLASTLSPNKKDSGFLQFQFSFGTMDKAAVPRLKSFEVYFECTPGVG